MLTVARERYARAFANRLVNECVAAVADAISRPEGEVVGAYLHGSLATGSYVAGRSDVDVLLIARDSLGDAAADRIFARLAAIAADALCRFDVEIVTADVAANPDPRPRVELYYGAHGPRPEVVLRDHQADLVVEFSAIRQAGAALIGPSPVELIAEPPPEWLDTRGRDLLDRWSDLTDDTAHAGLMVLTACRIWLWAVERRHASKEDAARWVLARAPALTAVAAALAQRAGDANPPITATAIADVLAAAHAAIRQ